jgi:hypothetical protein
VLEEVCKSALVLLFVKGAGEDDEAEAGSAAGFGVGEDGVAEAVFEGSEADGGVWGEVRLMLGKPGRGGRRGEGGKCGSEGGREEEGGEGEYAEAHGGSETWEGGGGKWESGGAGAHASFGGVASIARRGKRRGNGT